MKFEEFYLSDSQGKSNCIIRTFCKLFNKEYDDVKNELLELANKLKYDHYAEIEVFESYLKNNGYHKLDTYNDIKIRDLNLPVGKYAVFCYDKKDFYHMTSIINNVIYDKNTDSLDLYVISIYQDKITEK